MVTIVLDEFGSHTFVVPDGVYRITVTCTGKFGEQADIDVDVLPGQEILYYIESTEITDDTSDITYFGPYASAYSKHVPFPVPSKIEIKFTFS